MTDSQERFKITDVKPGEKVFLIYPGTTYRTSEKVITLTRVLKTKVVTDYVPHSEAKPFEFDKWGHLCSPHPSRHYPYLLRMTKQNIDWIAARKEKRLQMDKIREAKGKVESKLASLHSESEKWLEVQELLKDFNA